MKKFAILGISLAAIIVLFALLRQPSAPSLSAGEVGSALASEIYNANQITYSLTDKGEDGFSMNTIGISREKYLLHDTFLTDNGFTKGEVIETTTTEGLAIITETVWATDITECNITALLSIDISGNPIEPERFVIESSCINL